jgi:hypothetical protein
VRRQLLVWQSDNLAAPVGRLCNATHPLSLGDILSVSNVVNAPCCPFTGDTKRDGITHILDLTTGHFSEVKGG